MKKYYYALILLLWFWPATVRAQLRRDLNLPYLVQLPAGKTAPQLLLILMHGYGSNADDLFSLKAVLPADFIIISVQAPTNLGSNHYQWFSSGNTAQSAAGRKAAAEKMKIFIRQAVNTYHADPSRVYLSGFSQGAMMCYEIGLTAPELLKGIAPLSGRVFDALKPQVRKTAALSRLRVFIGHGDADNRVPSAAATAADAYLVQLGLKPELHIYKGMQHEIQPGEIKDLIAWLNAP